MESANGSIGRAPGLRLEARNGSVGIWSHRDDYDSPIVSVWKTPTGDLPLPADAMTSFRGLKRFLHVTITRVSDGRVVQDYRLRLCLNSYLPERIDPDSAAKSGYPYGCPRNPYVLGSVMGIEDGWAAGNLEARRIRLGYGRYELEATISPPYTRFFGIDPADATTTERLVVRKAEAGGVPGNVADSPTAEPESTAHQRPSTRTAGLVPTSQPDLRALPALGAEVGHHGTSLRFSATVWNAGDGPLVVDGFRRSGEDVMDAYQYFFDANGNETAHQQIGEMRWHAGNHNHWHFQDFARYRLLNKDMSLAVKSTKQSFCIGATDAVDYTVPNADWQPENTDLASACGGYTALWVRETLQSGNGDTYDQTRYGQAFKIGDLPNGVYWISVEANPTGNIVESDTTNNQSLRRVKLSGRGDRRTVEVFPAGTEVD